VNDMMFDAVRVTLAQARRAHSLVVMSHPAVGADEWRRFLRTTIHARRKDSGIVALKDNRRCIHALFTFRIASALGRGATLQVTEIAAMRLPGTVLVKSLMRFADDLALELALPSIAIEMQPSDIWTLDRHVMEQRGFTVDRVLMRGSARQRVAPPVDG
jgi:hypothetical protein